MKCMHNLPRILLVLVSLATLVLAPGCGRKQTGKVDIAWTQCVEDLTDPSGLPKLDPVNLRFISSFDRTGGNNDFNNFTGPGSEQGWYVVLEAQGPGCIRRLWMTGTDAGHPIRIYIDGERSPRIDTTIDQLFGGGVAPWSPPLAQYVNMCFYSYVPITYNKSVRIEVKEPNVHPLWGPRRIFYQVAVESFPAGTVVESYPEQFSSAQMEAAQKVAATLTAAVESRSTVLAGCATTVVEIASGLSVPLAELAGAGTISSFRIHATPADASGWTAEDRSLLEYGLSLRIRYGSSSNSVEVPLGPFFANMWDKRAYGASWFTSGPDGYACRLPLPFTNGITLALHNALARPVRVEFQIQHHGDVPANAGLLHAEYRRSRPDRGNHLVARVNGHGKYLGCTLGVTGLGKSWWILEGDERMWIDSSSSPGWHGTGLEDYFNGGWYYRGSTFGAFNGNFDRAPFRVSQFRHHQVDPVTFTNFFHMEFERMNDEQNGAPVSGYFESVAYWYQDAPAAVAPLPASLEQRPRIVHPNDQPTFMLQLTELERANDFEGARNAVERYLERYPGSEEKGVYALRLLEYRRLLGETSDADAYAPFIRGDHGPAAREQATLLEWFHAATNRALVGLYANGKGRLAINGKPVIGGDHPFNLFVSGIELDASPVLKLAGEVEWQRQDPWFQAGIRTHGGVSGTGPGTAATLKPAEGWMTADLASLDWHRVGIREINRGVPDAPYIGGVANAFVLLQSKSYPVTALNWSYYRGSAYFREDVELPVQNDPVFSRTMTGLAR